MEEEIRRLGNPKQLFRARPNHNLVQMTKENPKLETEIKYLVIHLNDGKCLGQKASASHIQAPFQ